MRGLQLGRADVARAELVGVETREPRIGAAVCAEDDRAESQVTRLIRQYVGGNAVQPKAYPRHRFPTRYTAADIELLASVDQAHETLSGPATQKVLQREFHDFGDARYGPRSR